MVQRVTGRTQLDTQRTIKWLEEHWKDNRVCPVCGHNSWSVSDDIVEMKPFRGGALVAGGAVYPLFAVTCNTCGLTLLFNAVVAGLIKGQE
jgi:hypothetical protein